MAKQTRRSTGMAKHWSEDEARAVLVKWTKSGLSGAAFAKTIGVVPQRLFWWRRRVSHVAQDTPAFVPVVAMEARAASENALVVTTANGMRIEVREVDASTAAWVVSVIGGIGA